MEGDSSCYCRFSWSLAFTIPQQSLPMSSFSIELPYDSGKALRVAAVSLVKHVPDIPAGYFFGPACFSLDLI